MIIKRNTFMNVIMVLAFTIAFTYIIPLKPLVNFFLTDDYSNYTHWLIPFLISLFFVLKSAIIGKIVKNWGFVLLSIGVVLVVSRIIFLYASTFVPGGGFTFVLSYYLALLNIPCRLIIGVGLLKVLLSLSGDEHEYYDNDTTVLHQIMLVLGFSVFLKYLFESAFEIFNRLLIHFNIGFLSIVSVFALTFFIIRIARFHERLTINYGIYLMGISAIILYLQGFGYLFLIEFLFNNPSDLSALNSSYFVILMFVMGLLKVLLIIGGLKVFLTLIPIDELE